MGKNIFISHSSHDKEVVKIFSELIQRVSLSQIHIWFSNDTNVNGGFLIGDDWLKSIIDNINKSQVVISFITPNSNNQPWILYESGYAEALDSCVLVPVKFAIDISEISIPLQHKQIYNLSGLEDLHVFLSKLLNLFNITYDKEIFQDTVQTYLKRIRDVWDVNNTVSKNLDFEDKLMERIEQKFEYYLENINKVFKSVGNEKYEVCFIYITNDREKREYISINSNMTVSDVLDEVYYVIYDFVKPYTYLESWVLTEIRTQQRLILNQSMQEKIPAQIIFKQNLFFQIDFLSKPLVVQ